jgi:hypothetical protein
VRARKYVEKRIETDVRLAVLFKYPDAIIELIEPFANGLGVSRWRLVSRKTTLTSGVTDLRIHHAHHPEHPTAHVELKTEDGRLRPSQSRYAKFCQSVGWPYRVCRSAHDVLQFLAETWK